MPRTWVARRRTQRRQVGAGAEGLARPGDDDGMHPRIALGPGHRLLQLLGHGVGDGVAPVGVVDRDDGDTLADAVENQITHGT